MSSARVLIIEDMLIDVKLLEEKLNNEYYDVVMASNGAQALEIIKDNPPDIILLGVVMSAVEGVETCRKLKGNPAFSYIPIIMVTTCGDPENRVQGLKAGADDFLTMPINDSALFARIRSLVRLKILTDELRMRDQTGVQFGIGHETAAIDTSNASVLVVDDNKLQIHYIAENLALFGHTVTVLKEPSTLVDEAIAGNYDLIIVSTLLQNLDGLRLCSQLKSQEKLRHIPLLVIVEEDNTSILVKAFDIGINDYLMLPIDGNEIVARASTQIMRKRYQDALKLNYQKNVSMAATDGLTGLYNRHYFDLHYTALFDKAVALSKSLSLLMIDIDHFKSVNDTYGHMVGDEILQQLGQHFLQNMRPTDLVARYGGEEFVILLPETDLAAATQMAEQLRLSIQKKIFSISGNKKPLERTISIGVSSLTDYDTKEELLKRADRGLYIAKGRGRNRVEIGE